MPKFVKSDKVRIYPGGSATILDDEPLGSGGQGEVYRVEYNGAPYALKWYTAKSIISNKGFYDNLKANAQASPPNGHFLWPSYVTEMKADGFGYLMKLIPSNYYSLSEILMTYKIKSKGNSVEKIPVKYTSLEKMIGSALRIVEAFRALHRMGMSYQDLNDGGIFIDPSSGEVLICDCDNVAPHGMGFGISGKPGYMAPEVVTHVSTPSASTDRYSLAVILFKLLMRGDPLEGAKVIACSALTGSNELEHYGTHPIFIYDPKDDSNRPVRGVHDNVIRMWPLYPDFIRDAFTKVFTDGLKNPSQRLTDNDWFNVLLRLQSCIFECGCGLSARFLDVASGTGYVCPGCRSTFPVYGISNGRKQYTVAIGPNTNLKSFQTEHLSEDYSKTTARMVESSKNPGLFGLKNEGLKEWTVTTKDGQKKNVPVGKAALFVDGMSITFSDNVTMEKVR